MGRKPRDRTRLIGGLAEHGGAQGQNCPSQFLTCAPTHVRPARRGGGHAEEPVRRRGFATTGSAKLKIKRT